VHFLNTSIKTEVPGEDWTVGTMSVINNTKELRKTFRYWANEVHKICHPLSPEEKSTVEKKNRQTFHLQVECYRDRPKHFLRNLYPQYLGQCFHRK